MLAQSVPYDDVSSATVQAVRVASRVEVTGNDEPEVKRGESVQQVVCDSARRPIDADDDERRRTMTDDPQSEWLELAVVADVDRCCPEGVAVDDDKTATTALGRRCAVTVDDSVAWWRNVELGGVRSVRRNPRLGKQQNVKYVGPVLIAVLTVGLNMSIELTNERMQIHLLSYRL